MTRNATEPSGEQVETMRAKSCPICQEAANERYRPFCSKRCADVDLGRWLTGSYAIPVRPEEDEDGDGDEAQMLMPDVPESGDKAGRFE